MPTSRHELTRWIPGLGGRLRSEGRGSSGRTYWKRGVLDIGLILAGCEHNYVVERTRFHRSAFSRNRHDHDISRDVARDAAPTGCMGKMLWVTIQNLFVEYAYTVFHAYWVLVPVCAARGDLGNGPAAGSHRARQEVSDSVG